MLTPALVADAMKAAQETERLSPAALAERQLRQWRDLVLFAAEHSPFYRRLYRGLDLRRAAPADLPTVTKGQIQQHFDEVVTDPRLKRDEVKRFCEAPPGRPWHLDAFAVLLTSGTTGVRGCYVWDAPALAAAVAAGFRQSNRGGDGGPPRLAAVMQTDATDATNVLLSQLPTAAGVTRLVDIRQDFDSICRELNDFAPTLLASYPYMLWLLAEAQKAGRLAIRPRRITSSADVLTASDRAAVEGAFRAPVFNYYCSTEIPYIAWECDAHDGLHVNADCVLLESVDAGNRPVPPGALGDKILVTNLTNRAMPLIRYEMSDQVEYASGPCPCGCPLPRVRTVAGRMEHILTLPGVDGAPVRLIEEYVDDIVGRSEEAATYQVIQEDAGRLTVNVVRRPPADAEQALEAVRQGLLRCFQKYGVDAARVRLDLRPVEALEPVQAGSSKVCRFWNRGR